MGRTLLIGRLAARDLRRRPLEAGLLSLAIMAAATTLTVGLLLHGVTARPYARTRAATSGPDVVASVSPPPFNGGRPANLTGLDALRRAPGVTGSSGPYPVIEAALGAHGDTAAVQVEGRDPGRASVDQPALTRGTWVRAGGVVVERSFAEAFRLRTGDGVTVDGHRFRVAGVAVTAAWTPYPSLFCLTPCGTQSATASGGPSLATHAPEPNPGLVWLTRSDLRGLGATTISYTMNLKLADPDRAPAFAQHYTGEGPDAPTLGAWQAISHEDGVLVTNEQRVLLTGSVLLSLLGLASIAVLVGGRMADQLRRVGLLKAVGATPRLIAAVLLAEYVFLGLIAAVVGLAVGRLAAPLLTDPGAGLVGSAGTVSLTATTAAAVIGVALAVAVIATFVPAIRAARTSTVLALADSPRPPRRAGAMIAISARLPVPLMLGLRIAARRTRRLVLSVASVTITVSGIVAVLAAHAQLSAQQVSVTAGLTDPRTARLNHVLVLITVMLVALAAVNAIVITWATVIDTRHGSALARALGATPRQLTAGLAAAQILPALAGGIIGVPAGIALFSALNPSRTTLAPQPWMLAVALGAPIITATLTALPARLGANRPIAAILQSEIT
jgi:ABC-type lipoprotein release transport system permease subunit